MTKLERANSSKQSADRLVSLLEHNAPELIIEAERNLLLTKLIRFPANEEHILQHEDIRNFVSQEEQAWLHKTGFYDDIEKQLKEQP